MTAVTLGNGQKVFVNSQGAYFDASGNPISSQSVATATKGAPAIISTPGSQTAPVKSAPTAASSPATVGSAASRATSLSDPGNRSLTGSLQTNTAGSTPQTAIQTPRSSPVAQTTPQPAPAVASATFAKQLASLQVSNGAKTALITMESNGGVTAVNATSNRSGYIYPPGTPAALQQQCAVLVQAIRPDVGLTSSWTKGKPVDLNTPAGTPIATFTPTTDKHPNTYPNDGQLRDSTGTVTRYAHTAIVVGPDPKKKNNLLVLEQYDTSATDTLNNSTTSTNRGKQMPASVNSYSLDFFKPYSTIATSTANSTGAR